MTPHRRAAHKKDSPLTIFAAGFALFPPLLLLLLLLLLLFALAFSFTGFLPVTTSNTVGSSLIRLNSRFLSTGPTTQPLSTPPGHAEHSHLPPGSAHCPTIQETGEWGNPHTLT